MSTPSRPRLVLGIDTGGTYTDAVLLEYDSRRVLATHKSLTTQRDFSLGIEQVIDGILIDDPADIRMVSVSTTLATNAIAEGKGQPVALFLLGYDPGLIATFHLDGRFATPEFFFFRGGHDLYGREQQELDLASILAKGNEIKDRVRAIAISGYFSPLNPDHENRAARAMKAVCGLPIVLGHQLSSELGSVERATTAALNASLLAVLQDFIIAVRRAMERRQIEAPLMVVRGDGTLMSDEFAALTPVETIHSGPAASAIGGRFLSNLDDALVIDVGGTTTDIATIESGQVSVREEGATVANFKTSVKAAHLLSIPLGGDSHIRWGPDKRIEIGPRRVTPLAYLASQESRVARKLRALADRASAHANPDWLEYWYIMREPPTNMDVPSTGERLLHLLRGSARPVPEILEHLGVLHVGQIGIDDLLRQEIIGKAGLTATDLMHIEGTFTEWDRQASEHAWKVFCQFHFGDPDQLREQVWKQMTETVLYSVLTFLTGKTLQMADSRRSTAGSDSDMGRWFFYNSLYEDHPQLKTQFTLRQPLIGIGAPASILLGGLSRALGADLILPQHHAVANALGAVAGSVMLEQQALVFPRLSRSGLEVRSYYVLANDERFEYEHLPDALAHARSLAEELALAGAIRSGADDPQVVVHQRADGLDTYRIVARAMGNPRLHR